MSQSLAEAQRIEIIPATFLKHFRLIADAKKIADEANMALTRLKKAAKADGVDLVSLKETVNLRKLDPDEAVLRIKHTHQYMAWLGTPIGTQASLFPDDSPSETVAAEQQEWEAGDAGYLAGKGGKLRGDNPFPEGTALYVQWDKHFLRGLKVLAADLRAKEDIAADKKADERAMQTPRPRGRPPTRRHNEEHAAIN